MHNLNQRWPLRSGSQDLRTPTAPGFRGGPGAAGHSPRFFWDHHLWNPIGRIWRGSAVSGPV